VLSWKQVNDTVCDMDEAQLIAMIDDELRGPKRTTVLVRLHQRYTRTRAARERAELLAAISGTTPPDGRCWLSPQ
jgi:hypothetical protein